MCLGCGPKKQQNKTTPSPGKKKKKKKRQKREKVPGLWLWLDWLKVGLGDFLLFCVFLEPHPQHMEVPRLGVELEL